MKALDYNGLDHLIDKIYDTVNSGGSADYIVEEGQNDIWYYRKWASGIAECWGRFISTVTWNKWGNVYQGTPSPQYATYPTGLFSTNPILSIVCYSTDGNSGTMGVEFYQAASTSRTPNFYAIRPDTGSTPASFQAAFDITARGLWKEFTQSVMKSATLDTYYPVGSIYISVSSTFNPNTSFGGTWVKLTNRFLVGAGGTYSLGATGGEATHTLTANEMPSHSHTNIYYNTGASSGVQDWGYNFSNGTKRGYRSAATESSGGIGNTGGGAAHNNLPPYQAVNMWQRTA